MKLNYSALLSCNLCSDQYNPHLTHSGLTPLTPHTVSNSLSVGLNKAKWQVSRDVTTPPCQSAMSGCCRLPGIEVFYIALRKTGVLCNSTREGMPKVFWLEAATGVGAQTKMNFSIIKEHFYASSFYLYCLLIPIHTTGGSKSLCDMEDMLTTLLHS